MKQRTLYTQRLTRYLISLLCWCMCFSYGNVAFSQEQLPSKDYVAKAWEALGRREFDKVLKYTNKCIELYGDEAERLSLEMTVFSAKGEESEYEVLNNVATCYFIQAESYMRQGKFEEAKKIFKSVIEAYEYAQAWDPRGWYWSVAEKAQASIDKLDKKQVTPRDQSILKPRPKRKKTELKLDNPGSEDIVNYKKYGKFRKIGKKNYSYEVLDPAGLMKATGEGVYPNTSYVRKDPAFRKAYKEKRLEGDHWDYIYTDDLEANFYKWAIASEPWGAKLFYIGLALERAQLYGQAIKAYYAIVVHFPSSFSWTYWHTPWYPGQAAIAKIRFLCRRHPELQMKLVDAKIEIINGFDNDVNNDIVITNPGRIVRETNKEKICSSFKVDKSQVKERRIKKRVGKGRVQLVQFRNKHWQLRVDGQPYEIRGITYTPTRVGQSPDEGTLENWMTEDHNNNGKIDGPYDSWVDKDRDGMQDEDEPVVGDFQLLKDMGINTIRLYHHPFDVNKQLLRDLYANYGIMVIMGDFLGKYALGSGVSWYEGTDYANPKHQKNMLESVKKMVMEFKDEPYILMWALGNENNYGVACNADKNPDAFFKFVNKAAKFIKSIDKEHPVAVVNGDTLFLDKFSKYSPDVDIFGANAYRGDYGFGSFWEQVMDSSGKPGFITEYGCPAYIEDRSIEEAEDAQAEYHLGCWEDIEYNMAGRTEGVGNALGGIIFEWIDEWWKAYEPSVHDKAALFNGPFPDGSMHEEWLGITAQGDGASSPYLRVLRKSYYTYKELWTNQK